MSEDIIISVAPNGAKKTKKDHPNIPLEPAEIATEVENCLREGAALVHLHIRDKNHIHSLDVKTYKETIAEIKAKTGDEIIIQVTSESVDIYQPDQQIAMVKELLPEAVSLAIREIIPDKSFENSARDFFKFLHDKNIHPQFILYSPEEAEYFAQLIERGFIPQKIRFILFVLGKKNGPAVESAYAKPADLDKFLKVYNEKLSDKNVIWATCAFGGYENDCMLEAVKNGGNPRIGFENNILLRDQTSAPSNAALIKQFVLAAKAQPRKIADVKTARKILGF